MLIQDPNILAYFAILCWTPLALILFLTRPIAEAITFAVLGALLVLPVQASFKIQMVPALDKTSVASVSAFLGCVLFAPSEKKARKNWTLRAIILVYVVSPVLSSILNPDPVFAGNRIIPGVDIYDGVSALLSQFIQFLPFIVGLRFITTPERAAQMLLVMCVLALFYTVLMLFEIRFSPQLSRWVYGVSFAFDTEMRYGGFRPVVFMANGLAAAFFLSTAVLACIAISKLGKRIGPVRADLASIYMFVVLLLSKSAGALLYAIFAGGLSVIARPRLQLRIALILATIAFVYPLLRINSLVPTDSIANVAEVVLNEERAQSLKFRFDQEQQLLQHASKKFWFGWGRFGRNRLYDEAGKDISITDGQWILTFGQFGFFGFAAQFALLVLPVFIAAGAATRYLNRRDNILLGCLSLIVALSAVEQIPNASITPWTWLLAGSLLGFGNALRQKERAARYSASNRSTKSLQSVPLATLN